MGKRKVDLGWEKVSGHLVKSYQPLKMVSGNSGVRGCVAGQQS